MCLPYWIALLVSVPTWRPSYGSLDSGIDTWFKSNCARSVVTNMRVHLSKFSGTKSRQRHATKSITIKSTKNCHRRANKQVPSKQCCCVVLHSWGSRIKLLNSIAAHTSGNSQQPSELGGHVTAMATTFKHEKAHNLQNLVTKDPTHRGFGHDGWNGARL